MENNDINLKYSYCSDKYQFTMSKSFYEFGKKDKKAVFNLFYRKAPENNNWAVVSGIEEVIEIIQNLGKAPESFFEKFLPQPEYKEFREYLSKLEFTGNVYAVKEGEIVFPNQPIITIEAPLIQAQILETPLLCIMNHQMAVATKSSRVCRATNKPIFEMGSRRAHGPWAAIYGAKAAVIAGCKASSNVICEELYGIPSIGTMSHSFITSYGTSVKGEYEAFCDYIKSHIGEPITLLVDTYDTLRCGIINAIKAFKDMGINDDYKPGYAIRLDSGDLAYLSIKVREILDKNGLKNCKITASNSLDEYLIIDLERQGAKIDSYGVGDAIATSKAAPCFGNVYKLVEIDGEPVLKMSEDKIKLINPGFQVTYRLIEKDDNDKEIYKADVTCLQGDKLSKDIEAGQDIEIHDEYDLYKSTQFTKGNYTYQILQDKVIENGKVIRPNNSLEEKKNYFKQVLDRFSPSERRLTNPHYHKVDISDDLSNLKMSIIGKLVKEIKKLKI